jgi:hypothetical protein
MTDGELVNSLKTPGALLACYFIVPPLLGFALGSLGLPLSDLAQAGFGAAVLHKLAPLRAELAGRLELWLGQFRQPKEKTAFLAGRAVRVGSWLAAAALMLPPLSAMLPRPLAFLANIGTIAWVAWSAYGVWQLYVPFSETPPEAPEPKPEPARPEPPGRRCPRCGQKLEPADEFCGFCRAPAERRGPPPPLSL